MKPHHLVMLATVAVAVAASARWAEAGKSTSVFRQGNSTAIVTQEGGSSPTLRRVIRRGPNSQTVIQQQGGNSAVITQN